MASRTTVDDLLREARARIDRLEPLQAEQEIASGALLIDTRCTDDRRREGRIAGALHVPRTVLEWRADPASDASDERIAQLDARLILMCNDGYSSSLAAANLSRMGFCCVADLAGGYRAWVKAGLPIEND